MNSVFKIFQPKPIAFLLMVCFLAFINKATANNYVVSSAAELSALLTNVKAGDIIVWKDGAYINDTINFSPSVRGDLGKAILLRAETAGKVSFSGNTQLVFGKDFLQVEGFIFTGECTLANKENVVQFNDKANHCRLTNCAITNYSATEESGIDNFYVCIKGTYNEVDHCYFMGKINKGPVMVVEYKQEPGFVPGSDVAPSSYDHIHHNYFGYRTFSANGGEQMRIGVSQTSFTHGFNIIEYNYFDDERLEAEVVSNKSCDNIYRFNTFMGNDGGMVIRHGQRCFVYGNYINGKSGRNESAGLRIVNPNNTVFNNYVENCEGGEKGMRSPITIMSGLEGSTVSGYFPADNAIVAYNTVVNSVGPAIKLAVGNANKGKALVAPKNVLVANNTIINTIGKSANPFELADTLATYNLTNNAYTNGTTNEKGFKKLSTAPQKDKLGYYIVKPIINKVVIDSINARLAIHKIKLTTAAITTFNPAWILKKQDVGVSWIK